MIWLVEDFEFDGESPQVVDAWDGCIDESFGAGMCCANPAVVETHDKFQVRVLPPDSFEHVILGEAQNLERLDSRFSDDEVIAFGERVVISGM